MLWDFLLFSLGFCPVPTIIYAIKKMRKRRIRLSELWCLLYPDTRRRIRTRWKIRNADTSLAQSDYQGWVSLVDGEIQEAEKLSVSSKIQAVEKHPLQASIIKSFGIPPPAIVRNPISHYAHCSCATCYGTRGRLSIVHENCVSLCNNLNFSGLYKYEPEFDFNAFAIRYCRLKGEWSIAQENEMIRLFRNHPSRKW